MIFITGGTGLIGANLLLKLVDNDEPIRALKRKSSNLSSLQNFFKIHNKEEKFHLIEWIDGDLLDVTFFPEALENIETIIHAAASVNFDERKSQEIIETNVTGTENLVNAAIDKKIKEFIFISSIAVLDDVNPISKKIDEESAFNPNKKHSTYALSKFKAEMEVWRGSQENLDVIVVNPSVVIGSLDGKRASERIFKNQKSNHFAPSGGTGFVDVRDVAEIVLRLKSEKKYNQRYLLNSQNLTYFEVLNQVNTKYNQKTKQVSNSQLKWISRFSQVGKLFGFPSLDKGTLEAITTFTEIDHQKIVKDLDYQFINIKDSIDYHFDYYKNLKL